MDDLDRKVDELRRSAKRAGLLKALLGVALTVAAPVGGYVLYTSGTFDGDNALMLAAGVGLFLAQGVYLVYRGARQLAVASGSLVRARVLSAKAQTTGDNPENRSLTFVLELEVEAPDASDENGRVVALSTNVFTKPTADGCVGRTISVLWTPRFPTDAVAFPD